MLVEVAQDEASDYISTGSSDIITINATEALAAHSFSKSEFKSLNTLIRFLLKIPDEDIQKFQENGNEISKLFRFYGYNSAMKDTIPIAIHAFPDGEAPRMLSKALSNIKSEGISNISENCVVEKNRKHKYISQYPCEKNKNRC